MRLVAELSRAINSSWGAGAKLPSISAYFLHFVYAVEYVVGAHKQQLVAA